MKAAYVALTLLAGCAGTADLLETGHRFQFTSTREPKAEAHCVARNAERHPFMRGTVPTVREGDRPGVYEVVVNVPLLANTDALVIIEPAAKGSAITVYALGDRDFYENRAKEYVEGCSVESPRRVEREVEQAPRRQPGTASER